MSRGAPCRTAGRPAALIVLAPALALLAPALLAVSCTAPWRPAPGSRNTNLAVKYVGAATCLSCHGAVGQTFSRTGMGRAFYTPDVATAVEDFSVHNRLEIPAERLVYEMTEAQGRCRMRQSVLDEDGSVLASAEKVIAYVVGSGNHSRSYLTGREGYLYQMPVCWYPGKPGWDLCPGYELKNRHFSREADDSCLFCHNGRMTLVPGTTNRYSDPIPHGIDCERCHGPGELHAALWTNPPDPPPDHDDTIVNPRKLPRETRMHVCLQCHLGDNDGTERVGRTSRDLMDFRPGGLLSDFVDPIAYDPPAENRFALGGQGDRLMLSRCYTDSGGRVDCLTCHDPHVTIYADDRPADHFRRACLGCHHADACALPEPERRARQAADDCTACHMRKSEPADQRFTAFTDHWIRRRIDPPGPPAPGRPSLELAPIFPHAHEQYGKGESLLDLARAYLAMKTTHIDGPKIPWSKAEEPLREALEYDPKRAEIWFLLGKTALGRGDTNEAIGDLREALKLEPGHRYARLNLAAALLSVDRASEAAMLLQEEIAGNPGDAAAMSDLARALVTMGREEDAASMIDRALRAAPDDPTLLANAGMIAEKRGRHEEAITLLRDAAALDPSSAEIWSALAGSMVEARRGREAVGPARRAARLRPGLPGAHFALARALAATGRREEAESELREAMRLKPGYPEAAAALRELKSPG
jgi:Flp pilus assembly protein TadD